jgi:hypothetical protein
VPVFWVLNRALKIYPCVQHIDRYSLSKPVLDEFDSSVFITGSSNILSHPGRDSSLAVNCSKHMVWTTCSTTAVTRGKVMPKNIAFFDIIFGHQPFNQRNRRSLLCASQRVCGSPNVFDSDRPPVGPFAVIGAQRILDHLINVTVAIDNIMS